MSRREATQKPRSKTRGPISGNLPRRFPLRHRKVIRTTNLLERLFLEERRHTKIIPHAERPVLKLMYAAVIRAADRWPGITVGEFEGGRLRDSLDGAWSGRESLSSWHGRRRGGRRPGSLDDDGVFCARRQPDERCEQREHEHRRFQGRVHELSSDCRGVCPSQWFLFFLAWPGGTNACAPIFLA